jgi:hypothetical protein
MRRRSFKLTVDLSGAFTRLEQGQTALIPIEFTATKSYSVELSISASGDELMPLCPKRTIKIPQSERPVRACVEVFAIAPTRRPLAVTIKAVTDDGLPQQVEIMLEVQPAS